METSQVAERDTEETQRIVVRNEKGQIVKGSSLNPYGRPRKGKTYRELAAALPDKKKQQIIEAQYSKAVSGQDTRAAEFLRDTAEGKPKQEVDVHSAADEWRMELLGQLLASGGAQVVDAEVRLIEGDETNG